MTTAFFPVQMFPIPANSPHSFHKLGSEFLNAARLVFENGNPDLHFPGYTLVAQAIELYLKAFLLAKGQNVNNLKSIGHNLTLAFETAEKHGLSKHFIIRADERGYLEKLSVVYKNKDFQYKVQGTWELPFPGWTIDFADRLSQCVTY
jgi:hypothetical protein